MYGDDLYMMGAVSSLAQRIAAARPQVMSRFDRRVASARNITPAANVQVARAAEVIEQLDEPVPGVPGFSAGQVPLGFTTVQFAAATAAILTATAQPQRPIKGARLVVDIARTGATATGLVTIANIFVGATSIFPSAQPVSATAFAPTAFQTMLSLPSAGQGAIITVQYAVSALPGGTDTIDIATTLIGPSVYG